MKGSKSENKQTSKTYIQGKQDKDIAAKNEHKDNRQEADFHYFQRGENVCRSRRIVGGRRGGDRFDEGTGVQMRRKQLNTAEGGGRNARGEIETAGATGGPTVLLAFLQQQTAGRVSGQCEADQMRGIAGRQ